MQGNATKIASLSIEEPDRLAALRARRPDRQPGRSDDGGDRPPGRQRARREARFDQRDPCGAARFKVKTLLMAIQELATR